MYDQNEYLAKSVSYEIRSIGENKKNHAEKENEYDFT
jgi:hypothetical protein